MRNPPIYERDGYRVVWLEYSGGYTVAGKGRYADRFKTVAEARAWIDTQCEANA